MKFISRLAVTVFAVSMLAMPAPALAGDEGGEVEAAANGWYVRVGGQFTDLDDHGAKGYSVHAGREISDYLAAEIGWLHVLDAESSEASLLPSGKPHTLSKVRRALSRSEARHCTPMVAVKSCPSSPLSSFSQNSSPPPNTRSNGPSLRALNSLLMG